MKQLLLIIILWLSNQAYVCSQTISACDFFPKTNEVVYHYSEPGLFGTQTNEIKYVFQENVTLQGKTYKAYNKYVNGAVPEVNRVLYVSCSANSLIMGNEIYTFNKEQVGYSQNLFKIWDTAPLYEVSMKPTGTYYLPIVIKPNNPIGETWTEKSSMHGELVEVTSKMADKNISLEVQGKTFNNVYVVAQEVWSQGGVGGRQKILDNTNYYAKDFGLIKSVRTMYVMGSGMEMVTELINNEGKDQIIAELTAILDKLPNNAEIDNMLNIVTANKDNIPIDTLKETLNEFRKIAQAYENEQSLEREESLTFPQIDDRLRREGKIDPSLVGTWKEIKKGRYFYVFHPDGTVETYMTTMEKHNREFPSHLWRVTNNNTLERLFSRFDGTNDYTHYTYTLKKSKDIQTGTPIITLTETNQQLNREVSFIKID